MPTPALAATLTRSKPVTVWIVVLAVGIHLALKVLFFGNSFSAWFAPVVLATGGIVSLSTIAIWVEIIFVIGLVVFGLGRQGCSDLGLTRRGFASALPILITLWAVGLLAVAIANVGAGGRVEMLTAGELSPLIGSALENAGSAAVFEELFYRGFLLTQVFLLLRGRTGMSATGAMLTSVIVTQVFFGLNHIPALIMAGDSPIHIAIFVLQIALVGCMFCALYLHTENLFLCIGMHALINEPLLLIASSIPAQVVMLGVALFAIAAVPAFARMKGSLIVHPSELKRAYE